MAGHRENILTFGVTIQPTPGTFNAPGAGDYIPVSTPDNGFDPITADDDTLTGTIWAAPRQFLGSRGRAGATARLRGPGGSVVPAAGAWPLGRILMAAGFSEVRTAAAITATVQANAVTDSIKLEAGASAVDDFYKGMPISHAGIGTGIRAFSMIREYVGATKVAQLMETLGAAINAGDYTIPPSLTYLLSTGTSIPLLSCSVWRHKKRYDYRDCALSNFAINIPVSNDQNKESPSIEFSMVGDDHAEADEDAPALPSSILTPPPPAKAGKFALAGVKIGHQSLRLEFGLETGAPPNQNFDEGQESYEVLSGTRTIALDVNQQLATSLDIRSLWKNQTQIPVLSVWGLGSGNKFVAGVSQAVLDPLSPNGRNGFVGVQGNAVPTDLDKAIALAVLFDG
jgi:hypothetical protein